MTSRDHLKAMLDRIPEARLEAVQQMLDHHIHPRQPDPEIEAIQRSGRLYRDQVLQRFRETRRPGTVGSVGGTGSAGKHEGIAYGRQGFHYWDEKALVHQTLQTFDGQQIEVMERLSFSPDGSAFICELELSSGDHTARHVDQFPVRKLAL